MSWFKERLKIAEVDGITFYTYRALNRYLKEKELAERRIGLNCYFYHTSSYYHQDHIMNLLEQNDCFDYRRCENGVEYWAPNCLIFAYENC